MSGVREAFGVWANAAAETANAGTVSNKAAIHGLMICMVVLFTIYALSTVLPNPLVSSLRLRLTVVLTSAAHWHTLPWHTTPFR